MLKSYSLDWEPPATTIVSPVIYEESSLHKNAATPAHSSDCPILFKEFDSLIVFKASSFSHRARLKFRWFIYFIALKYFTYLKFVWITPGAIQLTLIPIGPHSADNTLVRPSKAVLLTEYGPRSYKFK